MLALIFEYIKQNDVITVDGDNALSICVNSDAGDEAVFEEKQKISPKLLSLGLKMLFDMIKKSSTGTARTGTNTLWFY